MLFTWVCDLQLVLLLTCKRNFPFTFQFNVVLVSRNNKKIDTNHSESISPVRKSSIFKFKICGLVRVDNSNSELLLSNELSFPYTRKYHLIVGLCHFKRMLFFWNWPEISRKNWAESFWPDTSISPASTQENEWSEI